MVKIEIIIPSAAILCIRPSPSEQHSNFVSVSYYYLAVIQVQNHVPTEKLNFVCLFVFFVFLFFCFNVFMYNRFNASKERKAVNQSGPCMSIRRLQRDFRLFLLKRIHSVLMH